MDISDAYYDILPDTIEIEPLKSQGCIAGIRPAAADEFCVIYCQLDAVFVAQREHHLLRNEFAQELDILGVIVLLLQGNINDVDVAEFESTDFVAIPIVKDVDLLTDYVPKENRQSWALVDRDAPSIRGRKNMVCVEIHDNLMMPTIGPDDWCLIDRDKHMEESGRMYLCRNPSGTRTAVRRVTFKHEGGDIYIICVNDNHTLARAEVYSLKRDYDGDITKAILGQVVWIRADARNK